MIAVVILCYATGRALAAPSYDYLFCTDLSGKGYRVETKAGQLLCSAATAQEVGDKLFGAARHGVIQFGVGRYRGKWKIRGADGLTIQGGSGKAVIECPNTFATCFIIGVPGATSTENRNITVRDLIFDGRVDQGSGGSGLILSACDGFLLENLTFLNEAPMEDAANQTHLEYARTLNLTVWTKDQAPCRHGTVKNCRFIGTTLTCGGLEDVRLENLYFSGDRRNSNSVIDVSFGEVGPAAMLENVSFKNITIDNATGHFVDEHGVRSPLDSLIGGFQYVKNISFDHVKIDCPDQRTSAFHFYAWPAGAKFCEESVSLTNSTIRNVHEIWSVPHSTISNCQFSNFDYGIDAPDAVVKNCVFDHSK